MNKVDKFNIKFKDAFVRFLQIGSTASNAIGTDTTVSIGGVTFVKYGFDIRQVL
jgi:hypothetical protein